MHIAVCDDNIADRKQSERLLGREADSRKEITEPLYVDYFGSPESLLYAPMIYDALLLDLTGNGNDALAVAHTLRESGHQLPIVFLCSKINYRDTSSLPEHALFLDKPIKAAELTQMIDVLFTIKSRAIQRMEFRDNHNTYYIHPDEIIYAEMDGNYAKLHLANGDSYRCICSLDTLISQFNVYECFFLIRDKIIANINHVKKIKGLTIFLDNDVTLKAALTEYSYLREVASLLKSTT